MEQYNNSKSAKSFTSLTVWQKAHQFVLATYQASHGFPDTERYGLTSQIQRASISITSNIAEGFVRSGDRDKVKFYNTALGSLAETQNQLLLARDLGYLDEAHFKELANQTVTISTLLNGLIKSIRDQQHSRTTYYMLRNIGSPIFS